MRVAMLALALELGVCLTASAEWSFTRQVYSCTTSGMTFQELASAGVTYVSHVPARAETAQEAHRWGVRIMPYVSLYKVVDSSENPAFKTAPFWKEIDLVDHPDWVLIREDGKRRRPFDDPNYPAGLYQSCCNQPGIADAYVRGVENVLATGADGVFVDNVHPYPKCYGPELGIHQHLYPDKNNTEMYKEALMKVYKAVKAHGPQFAVMLNSGGPRHEYIGFGDTLMWESFAFRWPSEEMKRNPAVLCRTHDWPAVLRAYEDWKDFTEAGGSVAPLTYLPVRELEKPHAFLAYVSAKVCGFQQWTAEASERQDILRQLYRTDTGMPVGPLEGDGPVYYRRYEHALVVGNSAAEQVRAELPWHLDSPHVADLYTGEILGAHDGVLRVELPPDSGRVYVTEDAYLSNCLGEVAGMAQSCSLRLAELAETGSVPADAATAAKEVFDAALERANECRKAVREGGVPADAEGRQQVMGLAREVEPLEETKDDDSVEGRLLAGEGLRAQDLPELLRARADLPFEVEVGEGSVRLRSGGATFSFESGGDRARFRLGQRGMTLWVSPSGLEGDHGWLHARRLEDIKVTRDDPDAKTAQFVIKLYDSKSQQEVDGLDVIVNATIRRRLPSLRLESALRNHTGKALKSHYWFWNLGAIWHSFPDGTTIRPKDWGTPDDYEWDYLHATETGGGGLVVAEYDNMGYGAGQADMFGQPKNQDIAPDGQASINWTTYVVWAPWQRDSFLHKRLRWYQQYASLAAEVVAGMRLGMQVPSQLVASVPTAVTVSLSGRQARDVGNADFALRASSDGRELEVAAAQQTGHRRRFTIQVPADLGEGRRVELRATALVEGDGEPVKLMTFKTLRVRAAVRLGELRQAPVAEGGLGFAASLRNNLPEPLPVTLKLSSEALPGVSQTAVLDGDAESVVTLHSAEAEIPATADKVNVKLTVSYQLPDGTPISTNYEREIALLPQAVCRTAVKPPTLDGKLDDNCWSSATKLTSFVDHQTGAPAKKQTVCYVAADDANLYVAFDCAEQDMKHLRAEAKPDENGLNSNVPRDDSVELYVDPRVPGKKFFRLALNSLGAAKSSATGGWEVATAVEADRWIVEVRIPFDLIGARPKPGDVWGFNACRNDQGSGQASAWSCTQGSYSKPERFGGLGFEK